MNRSGARVGILMLQTRFPRIVGDVGNAETWPFPVVYRIVEGTSAEAIVRRLDPSRWEAPFVRAARELEALGVDCIATGCGFLILLQDRLQAAVRVPVLSSSLVQAGWLLALLPSDRKIGVLTFEAASLTTAHLAAARIDPARVAVRGLEGTAFHRTILEDRLELDVDRARRDHVRVARELVAEHPELAALVLECTNMPPYTAAIREATGLPVFDLTTLLGWAAGALVQEHQLAGGSFH
ncbi:MAG: aspartate/glutamate racemase family protein [Candidatus Eremiobacteraeota bacterium]|nr:aspartate/glutamate racemase family protein [Candidatus Eremiobacteraeota bacterium]